MESTLRSEINQSIADGRKKLHRGQFFDALTTLTNVWDKTRDQLDELGDLAVESLGLICECYFELGEFDNAQVMACRTRNSSDCSRREIRSTSDRRVTIQSLQE